MQLVTKTVLSVLSFIILNSPAFAIDFKPPTKYLDKNLTVEAPNEDRFPSHMITSGEFVASKHSEWRACQPASALTAAPTWEPLDEFLETATYVSSLQEMDHRNLFEGRVTVQPWSGDYWAIASGILGARYFDDAFTNLFDWISRFTFIQKNPASSVISAGGPTAVRGLAPAEKYDMLIGDTGGKLTEMMWKQGKAYYDENGDVESWMGICHGWAPAAIREPRPINSIEVTSLDQKYSIHLNPSELKGLVSYSWANNRYSSVMLGDRCNEKSPKVDENGRIIDERCFDTNPGSWHQAIVNSVGVFGRSFVMDATYDYQVWNQPVLTYSYNYFNPQSGQPEKDLKKASVDRATFTSDKYAKYRSSQAKTIVGISMKVAYVVETQANLNEKDSTNDDSIRWVKYDYDLELDSTGKIIGGEWHQTAHPDFLWVPINGAHPISPYDHLMSVGEWSGNASVPLKWSQLGQQASARGIMINTIAEALILRASK